MEDDKPLLKDFSPEKIMGDNYSPGSIDIVLKKPTIWARIKLFFNRFSCARTETVSTYKAM
jgi:hypothetical protein